MADPLIFDQVYRIEQDPTNPGSYTVVAFSSQDATVVERPGGNNDDLNLTVGEGIIVTVDSNPRNAVYIGDFEGGVIFARGDRLFLASNKDYVPDTVVTPSYVPTPVCFLPGTMIATPNGCVAVEALEPGALISTPSGPQAVKFVARTTCEVNHLRAIGKMPVVISAGALGELGPERDTYMSPSHAIHFEGHLVEAGALINGESVVQLETWQDAGTITYFNIELQSHSLIWANGILAETYFANYRTNGFSRDSWDNYAQYIQLYGRSELMDELSMPRIPFARQLPVSLRLLLQLNEPVSSSEVSPVFSH
jgi:hypothetical protein